MPYTCTLSTVMAEAGSGQSIGGDQVVSRSADGLTKRLVSVPATSEVEVTIAFDVSESVMVGIVSRSGPSVTIRTNADSNGSPDKTITLPAGESIGWSDAAGDSANPFGSVDVTALYIENEGESEAVVEIWVLHDATP